MNNAEVKFLEKAIQNVAKSIEKNTKTLEKLVELKTIEVNRNIEVSLNTSINNTQVFVTKIHTDGVDDQTSMGNFAKMLQSLGNVLLTMEEDKQKE